MIYLILSILCSTSIYALFKLFGRYNIHTFQAIVANYFVASGFGFWYAASQGAPVGVSGTESWMWIAAVIGVLFISLFYIMALTSQLHGVSVTSIATKMSMVIPAAFFIFTDPEEGITTQKLLGIILGVAAVILSSLRKNAEKKVHRAWLIPMVLFVGSGFLDLLLAYTEKTHLATQLDYKAFVPVPFALSAMIGTVILSVRVILKKDKIHLKSLAAGIALGLVNYGSIYFLLRILGSGILDRSSAIPANNMGVVALSAIVGFAIFKERLSAKNIIGIVLALAAILLLTWRGL
ncbi:EamA/RhaT family transporter [Cryomorpha ignava]|uniref:EamA/RhaT family transporter n=1 Tax=Cryomorpha ignava TaxID=101383 RepID=A0A7K3WTF5_9FLAO|nr:EamA/RhaT family transporter [Cryomorpha ignava]NEN24967.1 EamA/RhaT family transporter [Cryomorpha ignava]